MACIVSIFAAPPAIRRRWCPKGDPVSGLRRYGAHILRVAGTAINSIRPVPLPTVRPRPHSPRVHQIAFPAHRSTQEATRPWPKSRQPPPRTDRALSLQHPPRRLSSQRRCLQAQSDLRSHLPGSPRWPGRRSPRCPTPPLPYGIFREIELLTLLI